MAGNYRRKKKKKKERGKKRDGGWFFSDDLRRETSRESIGRARIEAWRARVQASSKMEEKRGEEQTRLATIIFIYSLDEMYKSVW